VWRRHESWKELFLGTVWAGMWVNIFFSGQGTHEKEKWSSQEKWRQEDRKAAVSRRSVDMKSGNSHV